MKVAIVTGATRGLGERIAHHLEEQGFRLAICSRSFEDRGSSRHYYVVDLRNKLQVEEFVGSVLAEFGRIDLLVNCAGYSGPAGPLEQTTDEELFECFQTNVFGPFYLMRNVVPIMKRQGSGMIINIASKSAIYANPHLAAYSSSKSALVTMTQALAKQFRDSSTNITCISVCPAGMDTTMREKAYHDSKKQQNPQRVADFISEIVNGELDVKQGDTFIVRRNEIITRELKDLVG